MNLWLHDGTERDVDRDAHRVYLDGTAVPRPLAAAVGERGWVRLADPRGAERLERGRVEVLVVDTGTVLR